MKIGDLVKMKPIAFWQLKAHRPQHYTEQPLLVMEQAHNAVKVLYPNGKIKSDLAEHYDVISEGIELTDGELEDVVGGMTREKFEHWRADMINEHGSIFNSKKGI